MHIRKIRKAVCFIGMVSLLCGLFGCRRAPKPPQHTLSELTGISLSCGHMDLSCSYTFFAHKAQDGWLLDADCFTHDYTAKTVLEGCMLTDEDATALLEILQQRDKIAYAENYKANNKHPFSVADETTYRFCLTFADEKQYATDDRQADLEEYFYRLAQKYAQAISK